jgi:MFS transporter, ACS family, tartrate transporter
MRRVSVRLMPLLFVLFICNYLDRTNVAIAKLQMTRDLGFSASAYGVGVGIFFVGYAILEIPSNLILARVGARRWIARIMITWGLIASAMMFVRTPFHFYVLRFLLGVAEAGFFPGIVYYLSHWFPAAHRGRALSRFIAATPIASVIGNPLSGWLLGFAGAHGLAGWQWVFLVEGIPSVLMGIAVLALLTDRPAEARWLSDEQRGWLTARLERDADQSAASHGLSAFQALKHPLVWLLSTLYFLVATANWTYVYWAPTIIRDALHVSDVRTSVITGGIAGVSAVVMLLVGTSSDRTGERFYHASACIAGIAFGWTSAALLPNPLARIAGLGVVSVGFMSFFAPFWCLPSAVLHGKSAAAGIALVNSIGNVGGAVAPSGFGVLQDLTGSTTAGMLVLGALAVCAATLCFGLRWHGAFAPIARRGAPAEILDDSSLASRTA